MFNAVVFVKFLHGGLPKTTLIFLTNPLHGWRIRTNSDLIKKRNRTEKCSCLLQQLSFPDNWVDNISFNNNQAGTFQRKKCCSIHV